MTRFLASTLMLIGLAALATPVHAADRPYESSGTAQFTSPTGDFIGAGNATHLGNYTEVGNAVISPTGAVTAWSIYTAANGSKLYASFTGQINATGGITATATYYGGTGRFADASGTAILTGQIQPDGTLVVAVEGTIDY